MDYRRLIKIHAQKERFCWRIWKFSWRIWKSENNFIELSK